MFFHNFVVKVLKEFNFSKYFWNIFSMQFIYNENTLYWVSFWLLHKFTLSLNCIISYVSYWQQAVVRGSLFNYINKFSFHHIQVEHACWISILCWIQVIPFCRLSAMRCLTPVNWGLELSFLYVCNRFKAERCDYSIYVCIQSF